MPTLEVGDRKTGLIENEEPVKKVLHAPGLAECLWPFAAAEGKEAEERCRGQSGRPGSLDVSTAVRTLTPGRLVERSSFPFSGDADMGSIWTEGGAIRAIGRKGFLNCFSSPKGRHFVVSSVPLSKCGTHLRHEVGRALVLKRKLELVRGDSFRAAYRLKAAFAQPPRRTAERRRDIAGHARPESPAPDPA